MLGSWTLTPGVRVERVDAEFTDRLASRASDNAYTVVSGIVEWRFPRALPTPHPLVEPATSLPGGRAPLAGRAGRPVLPPLGPHHCPAAPCPGTRSSGSA